MKELIKEYLRVNLSKERLSGYEDCYISDCFVKETQFDLYQFSEYIHNNPNDRFLNKHGYLSIMYLGVLMQSELFNIDILDLLTEENIEYLLEWKENNKDICNQSNLDTYDDKYEEGYDEGYHNGYSAGYNKGISESSKDDYNHGYDDGYEQGFIDCKTNMKEVNK